MNNIRNFSIFVNLEFNFLFNAKKTTNMKLNLKTLALVFASSLFIGFTSSCDNDEEDPILATTWYFGGDIPSISTGNSHYDQIITTDLTIASNKNLTLVLSDKDTIINQKLYYSCTFKENNFFVKTGYYSINGNKITIYQRQHDNTVSSLEYLLDTDGNEMTAQKNATFEVQEAIEFGNFEGVSSDATVNSAIISTSWVRKN